MVNVNRNDGRMERLLESLVTVVILLVLIQTFLDDFAIIAGWPEATQRLLLFTGLGFDIFFTIEFLVRLYNALAAGRAKRYLVNERGWIDFLASVPLLVFSSGPPTLAILLESSVVLEVGGILNMLKLIKAIRIARILRLLRIIKIFKNIKYAESVMAQRHLAKIITTCITGIVVALFAYSVLSDQMEGIGIDAQTRARETRLMTAFADQKPTPDMLEAIEKLEAEIILIKWDDQTIYTRFDQGAFESRYSTGDFERRQDGSLEVYFDRIDTNAIASRTDSWQTMFFFGIVLLILLSYLLIYSPHFALTVSDPIHVMKRGFDEKDYNLEVKVPDLYRDDDIFEMARKYNEVFLPLKDRSRESEDEGELDLQVEDIEDLF